MHFVHERILFNAYIVKNKSVLQKIRTSSPFLETHFVSIFKTHYVICKKNNVINSHKIINKKMEHIDKTNKRLYKLGYTTKINDLAIFNNMKMKYNHILRRNF